MTSSIDLSGTAHLPAASELREGAALLLKCSSRAGESIQQAHSHWSLLAAAYAAPEQHQVQSAMDGPRDAGQAVFEAASRAAAALETFAAVVDDIRAKRLLLQSASEEQQEKERDNAAPGLKLAGVQPPITLAGQLLQAKADQLAQDLAAAEDRCIRALDQSAGPDTGAGAGGRQPIGQCLL